MSRSSSDILVIVDRGGARLLPCSKAGRDMLKIRLGMRPSMPSVFVPEHSLRSTLLKLERDGCRIGGLV